MRSQFFHQYIVLCDAKTVSRVLRQALLLSMMSYPYNWLVVNMGLEQVDLDDLIAAHPNLTLLQLMVDPDSASCNLSSNDVSLANAILHDAFLLSMHLIEVEDNRTLSLGLESSTALSLVEETTIEDGYVKGNGCLKVSIHSIHFASFQRPMRHFLSSFSCCSWILDSHLFHRSLFLSISYFRYPHLLVHSPKSFKKRP
ncbi:unnamed protein product [Acanthosepion pharaonis]|uniref:Uncharacterized protein n=1 Tax=Acanthosepion pharaonis TaxID=158019 RepID=A0A812BN46_ACAPH|nr:unnamed protein product [Sepia pharaonis]